MAPNPSPHANPAELNGARFDAPLALAIAALAVIARLLVLRWTHSTTEDFYITARYAENIARGHGFVYNVGERVLGTSTPLYALVLAGGAALGLSPPALGKALNILADGATCFLLARTLWSVGRPGAGYAAALLYATTSAPINFAIGGMETGLVTLAALAAIYAAVRGHSLAMWITLAVLFLLRVDGLALSICLAGGWLLSGRRIAWAHCVAAVAIVLPWLVFATLYFGTPVPESLTAKLTVYRHVSVLGGNVIEFRKQFIGGGVQILLLMGCGIGVVHGWRVAPLRAPIVWMFIYYLAMLVAGVPTFGWYFVPPLPIYYACACLGLSTLAAQAARMFRQQATTAQLGPGAVRFASLLLAVPLLAHLRPIARDIAAAQRLEDGVREPMGKWIAANTPRSDRLLLEPIGYIGYFAHRYVIDMAGLVSPQVLPYYSRYADPLPHLVEDYRPELLALRMGEAERLGLFPRGAKPRISVPYGILSAFPAGKALPIFLLYRKREKER